MSGWGYLGRVKRTLDAGGRGPWDRFARPDGTPNRPLSVCRVAFEYELPRLPPVAKNPGHQSLLEQLYVDGAI